MARPGPRVPRTPQQDERWEQAWNVLRRRYGSYQRIARILTESTGHQISHVAVYYWWTNRDVPPEWARVITELTKGEVRLFDLLPWLDPRNVGIEL